MIGHNTTPVALLSRFKAIKGLLSRWRGQQGEDIGLKFLEKQGLTLIERNFSCRYGELDLIMQHEDILVFVEVKYRSGTTHGGAIAAVSPSKRHKLVRTAQYYLQQHGLSGRPVRFDVIAIDGTLPQAADDPGKVRWINNAFYADE